MNMQRFPRRADLVLCFAPGPFRLAAAPAGAQLATVPSPSGPGPSPGPISWSMPPPARRCCSAMPGAAWYPASLTKLMTLYLVFEELKAGRLTLATPVPFSEHAASMPPSKLGMAVGASITVEQAIQSLVARSANDVAVGARREGFGFGSGVRPAHDPDGQAARHDGDPIPQRQRPGPTRARSRRRAISPSWRWR